MTEANGKQNPHAEPTAPAEFAQTDDAADLTPLLKHLLEGHTLSQAQTTSAFEAMMTGRVHHGEIGALLALLAMRAPTADEIVGAARVMREHVDALETDLDADVLVDTAGTGGAPKTFNVSTASGIVAAAGGAKIAKHGNRSRTGRGSAEVLQALGVNVDAGRAVQRACLEETGICFCFAIHHHPATRHVMPVRLALGFPTLFNLLGPLTNPAGARRQVMGVYHDRFVRPIAEALRSLDAIDALVVHSADGLDEISISAPTRAIRVTGGELTEFTIDPVTCGLPISPIETVQAVDLGHAARLVREVISGKEQGPPRAMTMLSTAATLLVSGRTDSITDGVALAAEIIDSGRAQATLDDLVRLSQD